MGKKILIFTAIVLFIGSCSLQSLDDLEGVRWEYYLYSSKVVAGVEFLEDLIFFADDESTVYALNSSTGTYSWSYTLSNHNIISLYAEGSYLFVLTESSGNGYIFKYDVIFASLVDNAVVSLPFVPLPHYESEYVSFPNSQSIIIHTSNRVAVFDLDNMTTEYNADVSSSISDLVSVVGEDSDSDGDFEYFYLIGRNGKIKKTSRTLSVDNTFSCDLNEIFSGSALFANRYLFVGTDDGVHKIDKDSGLDGDSDTSLSVKYGQMYWNDDKIYIASSISKRGVGRWSSYLGFYQDWFYTSYSDITYSPVVVDRINDVAAFIDDNGTIHILSDNDNAAFRGLFEKYLVGNLMPGDVHIPIDYYSDIYIPFADKVLAYSLEWAANNTGSF